MRVTMTAALLAATLAASTVQAADCAHPTTQTDINMCANTSFKAADAKLNAIYKQITDRLKDRHRVRQSLVTAQRAWLDYRDAECAFAASAADGGTIHAMLISNCLKSLTLARTKTLQTYLKCPEGDLRCPVPAQ